MFAKLALLSITLNESKHLNQFVCFLELILDMVARFLDHFLFSSTVLFFWQKLIKIAAYHLSYVHGFVHGSIHGSAICWLWSPQSISLPLYWWAHNFSCSFHLLQSQRTEQIDRHFCQYVNTTLSFCEILHFSRWTRKKNCRERGKKIVASTDKCAKEENDIKSKYLIR